MKWTAPFFSPRYPGVPIIPFPAGLEHTTFQSKIQHAPYHTITCKSERNMHTNVCMLENNFNNRTIFQNKNLDTPASRTNTSRDWNQSNKRWNTIASAILLIDFYLPEKLTNQVYIVVYRSSRTLYTLHSAHLLLAFRSSFKFIDMQPTYHYTCVTWVRSSSGSTVKCLLTDFAQSHKSSNAWAFAIGVGAKPRPIPL